MFFLSVLISKSSSLGIRDIAIREIRNQIIVIHKDSTKRTNQLNRVLHSNPHLGLQFRLRSWWLTIVNRLGFPFLILHFLLEGCKYYIKSYPSIVLSNILQFILCPLYIIASISFSFLGMIFVVTIFIILLILFPWYYLTGLIFPMNIDLSMAYYRDIFDRNPDLDPPVIIDEMSDKLRSIVDNYTPLPSTTSFDYLRFVKETKTIKYMVTVSGGEDQPSYEEERELVVTGSFIEFVKYA